MIQKETVLNVVDNSGALRARCIELYKNGRYARPSNVIKVSIIKTIPNSKIKKGTIYKAIVLRTKFNFRRSNGIFIKSNSNDIVLIDDKLNMIGNRIDDYVMNEIPTEIRNKALGVF